jgi:uncharacterized pyridoxamine 5'-phosphate oxidase family protein
MQHLTIQLVVTIMVTTAKMNIVLFLGNYIIVNKYLRSLNLNFGGRKHMTIEQVKELLADGTIGYFATANGEQLEVRGWQYQFAEGNKFYFITANTKDVYKEMQANPQVAFAGVNEGYNIRISGKATFVVDKAEKEKAFAKISAQVQKMYESAANPAVEIFYIGSGEIKISKGYEPFEKIKF